MNFPTLRRFRPCALALGLLVALAQPILVTTPVHAATAPIVTDGGAVKALRVAWGRFGPIIITLAWDIVTDLFSGDSQPPPPADPPLPDPDFAP